MGKLTWRKVVEIIDYWMSVDLVSFGMWMGFGMLSLAKTKGIYEYACQSLFAHDVSVDCFNIGTIHNKHDNEEIQQKATLWGIFASLSVLIPSIPANILLGAISDIKGRKLPILIGSLGVCMLIYAFVGIFAGGNVPLYVMLIPSVFAGLSGYITIVILPCYAYLADFTVDQDMYLIRLAYFNLYAGLAGVLTGVLGGAIIDVVPLEEFCLIALGFAAFATLYAVVRLRSIAPAELKREQILQAREKQRTVTNPESQPDFIVEEPKAAKVTENMSVLVVALQSLSLMKDALHAFIQPRPGYHRAFINILLLTYGLMVSLNTGLLQIIGTYVFGAPLGWSASQLSYFGSVIAVTGMLGSLVGAVVFKRVFHLRETTIILISALSNIAQMIIVAVGRTTWAMYLAVAAGVVSNLISSGCKSFLMQIVAPDEVGKIFTGFGIAADVASIVGISLYSAIYYATVKIYPQLTFWIIASLVGLCFLMVLWVHVMFLGEENKRNKK